MVYIVEQVLIGMFMIGLVVFGLTLLITFIVSMIGLFRAIWEI